MNYPVWDVPHIGSGLMIAIIAIFHIMISHFAIGGGFYLPIAERMALKLVRSREGLLRDVQVKGLAQADMGAVPEGQGRAFFAGYDFAAVDPAVVSAARFVGGGFRILVIEIPVAGQAQGMGRTA